MIFEVRRLTLLLLVCSVTGSCAAGQDGGDSELSPSPSTAATGADGGAVEAGAFGLQDAGGDTGAALTLTPDTGTDAASTFASAADAGASGSCETTPATAAGVQAALQRSCALSQSCHTGSAPQGGLDLSTVDKLLSTVGRRSMQAASESLIVAGDPQRSYLVRKVRGMQTIGSQMPPPPATALCDGGVQALEGWIRAGAMR